MGCATIPHGATRSGTDKAGTSLGTTRESNPNVLLSSTVLLNAPFCMRYKKEVPNDLASVQY